MAVFTVAMVSGPGWEDGRPRREQSGWTGHADVMDQLVAEGFVLLGGQIQPWTIWLDGRRLTR